MTNFCSNASAQTLQFASANAASPEVQVQISTPLGPLLLVAAAEGLRRLEFEPARTAPTSSSLSSSELGSAIEQPQHFEDSAQHNKALAQQSAVGIPLKDTSALWPSPVSATTPLLQTQTLKQQQQLATCHLEHASAQLTDYFAGKRQQFALTLAPVGTAFQLRVWQLLAQLPFGHYCSYGFMARQLQNPGAVRAVGAANGKNPLAIVLPCHRVVASSGQLTGYAGGLARKIWLLQHEDGCTTL